MLLRDLHDSRICNQLLEPEASEDIWRNEDTSVTGTAVPDRYARERSVEDLEMESGNYLEANMKFMPGAFACPVVWEIPFYLHPRLKIGPSATGISRGIKALRVVLNAFSVSNRKNMFVYQNQMGNVFYLR